MEIMEIFKGKPKVTNLETEIRKRRVLQKRIDDAFAGKELPKEEEKKLGKNESMFAGALDNLRDYATDFDKRKKSMFGYEEQEVEVKKNEKKTKRKRSDRNRESGDVRRSFF